ncbi:MAG: hypothetical protein H7Y32_16510 [Chloroflexales bacterium]|nr:hypothetical protein [Chloroflexales bacterium]
MLNAAGRYRQSSVKELGDALDIGLGIEAERAQVAWAVGDPQVGVARERQGPRSTQPARTAQRAIYAQASALAPLVDTMLESVLERVRLAQRQFTITPTRLDLAVQAEALIAALQPALDTHHLVFQRRVGIGEIRKHQRLDKARPFALRFA